jgi:hypothetical protein
MRYFSSRERREADLFYADLMGIPARRRRRRTAPIEATSSSETEPAAVAERIGESRDEAFTETSLNPARAFDEVVHAGADPTPFLGETDEDVVWEPVALPNSATPPDALQPGALVVTRALGEGQLAILEVLGEDVQIESLYGEGNCIRPDVLVLDCRPVARPPQSPEPPGTIESWIQENAMSPGDVEAAGMLEAAETFADPEVIEIMRTPEETAASEIAAGLSTLEETAASEIVAGLSTLPETAASDIAAGLEFLERIEGQAVDSPAPALTPTAVSGVTIEAASGLGTSRTVAPIATVSPQRQMSEVLDRELILFAKARIVAEWIDRNLSATFEQAFNDAALRARLDVSKDKVLLDKLRPFPQQKIPPRRDQLFTTDAVLTTLLKAPADIAGLWPIFDVLHHYGVVLLPPDSRNPFGRPSVMASITRVDARLDRARFDAGTAAVEQHAIKFKKAVGNKNMLHHAIEPEAIPAEWSAGKRDQTLQVAKPVVALLRRLRELNQTWRAGTYPGHWWNDFSVDIFIAVGLEASGFWKRDSVRPFFRALNAACEQDAAPGRFAWKGIYNDAGLAQEMDGLYGTGRVLSGVEGHGPGPRMHVHLDLRPLTVPFDATTGFWLDGSRVVLTPPARGLVPAATPAPVQARTREEEDAGIGEAVPNRGRGRFRHAPLGGNGSNVEARWNVDASTAAGSTVDVVVYLHGYGAPAADFLARKAQSAGVDLVDSTGAVVVRASRPTLVLVPRGRNSSGSRWVFDALTDSAAFNALVDAGLSWLASNALRLPESSSLTRGRLTLIAHSGGGAAMSVLLASGLDPDEVVCFDSLYGGEVPVARWAERRIGSSAAMQSGLRAFYTPCGAASWNYWATDGKWHLISTEVAARRLQQAIERALSSAGDAALTSRFRVERTGVGHTAIPARYSPLLLDDIAATVPNATPAPPSTARPPCVANDDWLTQPPRRPAGDDPPAPKP